ncbi:MAG TPA: ankyrin repeat domain-containing protein [Castellaniella sp.]|uniref:ankyrin repeat domain-containing protein n=1 Tax=Castellaniella sp. TaxID=1955812 RepID=UPI002EE23954
MTTRVSISRGCGRWLVAASLGLSLGLGNLAWAQQAPGPDWWTAISQDDVSTTTGLLLRNVDPNAFNKMGNPALIQAARDQSWKVFDVLRVTPGVKIDEPNAHNETALMYLSIEGQTQRAEALIAAGAQVNRLGWTPLHYAASKGRVEVAKMLLAHQAIVNAPGPDGTTPLMMAALSGNQAMVDLLLAHGADPTMFNLAHETAADFARKRKYTNLAQSLDDAAAQRQAERQLGVDSNAPAKLPDAGAPASTAAGSQGTPVAPPSKGTDDKSSFSRYFDLEQSSEPTR